MSITITKEELYKKHYDYETLKSNIYAVSLTDILKTQTLTSDFCIKYILNSDFQLLEEDKLINMSTIKQYQPHITDGEFVQSLLKATNKLSRGEKIDSIEDFETYMNKHL